MFGENSIDESIDEHVNNFKVNTYIRTIDTTIVHKKIDLIIFLPMFKDSSLFLRHASTHKGNSERCFKITIRCIFNVLFNL